MIIRGVRNSCSLEIDIRPIDTALDKQCWAVPFERFVNEIGNIWRIGSAQRQYMNVREQHTQVLQVQIFIPEKKALISFPNAYFTACRTTCRKLRQTWTKCASSTTMQERHCANAHFRCATPTTVMKFLSVVSTNSGDINTT